MFSRFQDITFEDAAVERRTSKLEDLADCKIPRSKTLLVRLLLFVGGPLYCGKSRKYSESRVPLNSAPLNGAPLYIAHH